MLIVINCASYLSNQLWKYIFTTFLKQIDRCQRFLQCLQYKKRNTKKELPFPSTSIQSFSFLFFFNFIFFYYFSECWQLVIKSVNIPSTVKANNTDYVILDCDYDLENTPSNGLVIKWFFNVNEVAYQWIYGRDPLAGDITRKYVDLNYKASNDPCTTYRAMKLNKPGIDLTGEYRCVISTFADEQSASAFMVVYCKYFAIDYLCRIK